MNRSFAVAALLVAGLLLIAPGHAGSAEDPEVTDGNDDVTVGGAPACAPGNACTSPGGFVNLLSAWVAKETSETITFQIDSADNANAYGPADYVFHFSLDGTDYQAGLAAGQSSTSLGDDAEDPIGVASRAGWEDTLITIHVPREAIGSPAAGTVMTNLYVTSELDMLGQGAIIFEDRAPDADFGRDYVLTKGSAGGADSEPADDPAEDPAPVPEPEDNTTQEFNDDDADGLEDSWEQEHFEGNTSGPSDDPDLDNCDNACEQAAGTDPNNWDTDGDGVQDGDEVAAGSDPNDPFSVPTEEPEETQENATAGEEQLTDGETTDGEREVMAGLGFLTPAAEALGLDSALDELAEPVLLGLIVLLVLLLILLIVLLIPRKIITADSTPKKQVVGPGETADFDVTIANRRKTVRAVQVDMSNADWKTGLVLRQEGGITDTLTQDATATTITLAAKGDDGATATGRLHLHVPEDIPVDMREELSVTFTPLNDDGEPMTKKARTIDVQVDALLPDGDAVDGLALGDVTHEPATPRAGQEVLTTTTVSNGGDAPATLRVALVVDDEPTQFEVIDVAPGTSQPVTFPWTARDGRNTVKVQVYSA